MRIFANARFITALALTGALLFGCSESTTAGAGGTGGGGGAGGGAGGGSGDGAGGGGPITGVDAGDGAMDGGMPDPLPHEGFYHPGILVSQAMLDFVKAKIDAGEQPWAGALDHTASSWLGDLGYQPHAHETVECGPYSMPDVGCGDEKNDSVAAYTHALLWYHTGDEAHAQKAIEIMNAYAYTIRDHTNSNAPLQAAWVAEVFPRAAEIIRYTYSGWSSDDVEHFEKMLTDVYLPLITDGSGIGNGNWELSMIEAVMNIAVFTDDQALFDKAVRMWRERVPSYLYLESDGPEPVPAPRGYTAWNGAQTYVTGLCQETCRDLNHVRYGLAALINAAETARIQGVDLYGEESERIRQAMEFNAEIINNRPVDYGSWLCGIDHNQDYPDSDNHGMWEIAYNHYATTLGYDLPETQQLVEAVRPTGASHHIAWETLTHADIGGVGLP